MQKTWPKAHILRLQAMEEAEVKPAPAPEPTPVVVQQEPVAMVAPVLQAAPPAPPMVGAAPNPNA